MKNFRPETILDTSSGNPALLESWILHVIHFSGMWGHHVLISTSGGSGRFSWVGSGTQHSGKHTTESATVTESFGLFHTIQQYG